jgi:hypothetical protein
MVLSHWSLCALVTELPHSKSVGLMFPIFGGEWHCFGSAYAANLSKYADKGRGMAQVVGGRPFTWRIWFYSRPDCVRCLMDKRALGIVFLRVIHYCPVSMIPPIPQIHISFISHDVYSKQLTASITHFSADPGGCAVYNLLIYFWGLRFRTPLRAWMFISCVCCVGSGLCHGLITSWE